jgi:hypothetical protein
MQEPNRDMFPTPAMLERFKAIRPLLVNEPVDSAFNRHEAISVSAKRLYHRLGLLSILLVAGSAIYSIGETLLFPGAASTALSLAIVIASGLGIAAQVYMLAVKLKSRWLVNRFACERLRSLKFQGYAAAATARDAEDLAARLAPFTADGLARLENEINMGIAAFDTFDPNKSVDLPAPGPGPADPALEKMAVEAFRELRIQYQDRFAAAEIHRMREQRRYFHSTADVLYFAGGFLVLLSLLSKVVPAIPINIWIEFLAVVAFVLSISMDVLDNATLTAPSSSRFQRYREAIAGVENQIRNTVPLDVFVPQMERVALGELAEFCDASKSVNYRL